ncbi:MAG: hypothetical protein U0401_20740 [Anaerolineae bacterium]
MIGFDDALEIDENVVFILYDVIEGVRLAPKPARANARPAQKADPDLAHRAVLSIQGGVVRVKVQVIALLVVQPDKIIGIGGQRGDVNRFID